jgi:tetratricopeptide (TPR) repeat protein
MRVFIETAYWDFEPQYNPHKKRDNGWLKQNQDAFKVCLIGGRKVFVKRFEKESNQISGYNFLQKIKNIKHKNLPLIYDLVEQVETNSKVHYLFQEYIEGDTLFNIMIEYQKVLNFNANQFASNLFAAFDVISKHGFWFADFLEKNIFLSSKGDFYLIDLDSVESLSLLPSNEALINNVNSDYFVDIKNIYLKKLNYAWPLIQTQLRGDTLNHIQVLLFLAQMRYFLENINSDIQFRDSKTREALPIYLFNKNKKVVEEIFKMSISQAGQNKISIQAIALLNNNLLFPEKKTVVIDFKNNSYFYKQEYYCLESGRLLPIGSIPTQVSSPKSPIASQTNNEEDDKAALIIRLLNFAHHCLILDDFQKAEIAIKRILAIDPNNKEAIGLKSQIEKNKPTEKYVQLNTNKPETNTPTVQAQNQTNAATLNTLIYFIKTNIQDDNFDAAQININKALKVDPNNSEIKSLQNYLDCKKKDHDEITAELTSLKAAGFEPCKCPSCGFPVRKPQIDIFLFIFGFLIFLMFFELLTYGIVYGLINMEVELYKVIMLGLIPTIVLFYIMCFLAPIEDRAHVTERIKCKKCKLYYKYIIEKYE